MKLSSLLLPLTAIALTTPALAEEPAAPAAAQEEARIPFANHGGIRNWRSHDRDTLYIQGRDRTWYEVTLMSPATDLPFALAIGFDAGPADSFDKFSTVVVRGQRYAVQSVVKIDGKPPKKHEREDA